MIPKPPENYLCPIECDRNWTGNRCPESCYCEDHCSWERCMLTNPPDTCLANVDSKWLWDSQKMFWVAQFKGKIQKSPG